MGKSAWDAASVLAASNTWTWVPPGSPHVRTAEYLVVAGPEHLLTPTTVRVFGSSREPTALVDEVTAVAADWGRDTVSWRVSDWTTPAGLEDELVSRGGRVDVRLDVLGLPLEDGLPEVDVPPDVTVASVHDENTLRDAYAVARDAFGGGEPTQEEIDLDLGELRDGLPEGPVGRVVSYVDGQPAGAGGWTLVGPVCRLWGGGTRSDLRGRGAYRAVLSERLRLARERGATLGLTHGRVDTSSPILRRLGFRRYGEEREVVLDTSGSDSGGSPGG